MLPLAVLPSELTTKLSSMQFTQIGWIEWAAILQEYGMRVALAGIILFLAMTAAGWVARIVKSGLTRAKFDATLTKFMAKLVWWSIMCAAVLVSLEYFGIKTTTFAAVIGAAGLAIALGFQGTLSSLAAGSMLLVFRPYKVGDLVNIAGQLGTVDEIELFTTTVDTFDNRRIIIPNNSIFGAVIENITYHPERRIDIPVGVSYSADIDHTRQVLLEAIQSIHGVHANPKSAPVLIGLGTYSIDWQARLWVSTPDFAVKKEELIRAVKRYLDDAGIEIPFQQMDLNLRSLPREMASDQQQRKAA